ncbi:ErfK/YbiS/YcfS/YnhG family protein [Thermodesulfatator indicus DSM 15286]|uniref:ErfK/YbiS/YcfS/YnhG family protein n=1 Tax=Thermodesulfatator indicus (strain DSM 15286 / JCM 11887 / CIR29812) TaxID=667014 RepID=F8ABV3_THEID|nr:ErfK/YbiS/YcfS/YnhG family protein [Thermodesulfatator indicus DSM 15286]
MALILLVFAGNALALDRYVWDSHHTVVGEVKKHVISENETLLDIARWYDLGYNQIILANPKYDPWIPPPGKEAVIPTQYVLPSVKTGLVVNLAEMRLYFFTREGNKKIVYTAPIGIGTDGKLTELGIYTIVRKRKNPPWHVPESIRKEEPDLPEVVPPGPNNPLGTRALYLSRGSYMIHGTNKPWGIGRRVSHGCMRLYPEDIEALYPLVPVGTPVTVIYEPYKLGVKDNKIYLQVFPDFENKVASSFAEIMRLANILKKEQGGKIILYWMEIRKYLENKDGIPHIVGEIRGIPPAKN